MKRLRPFLLAIPILTSPLVFAHTGHQSSQGFAAGWLHPLSGIDHLMAMIAVGLLAGQRGGTALWALPATFIVTMIFGGLLALGHVALPLVEPAITTSVLVLGVCVALTTAIPPSALLILPSLFAVCHGYAHVADIPAGTSLAEYFSGFLLATSLLLSTGMLMGIVARRFMPKIVTHFTGASIATCGLLLFAHLL